MRGSCGGFCAPQAKKIFPHQALSWLRAGLSAGPQPPSVMGQKARCSHLGLFARYFGRAPTKAGPLAGRKGHL